MSFNNTGNPVPSIDPRDLDDNAKHIDELTNSTLPTFVDRLGTTRRTLAGIEADADAIVLRDELASSTGSDLIGYLSGTLSEEIAGKVNVLRHGADPLSADNTAAFIAADAEAAAKGWQVYVPGGTGFTVGNLTLTAPLTGNGKTSKIIRKTGTSGPWITVGNVNAHLIGLVCDGAWVTGDGVEINALDDIVVYRNLFTRIGGQTIHFNDCDNLSIDENKISNCTNGITNLMPSGSVLAQISRGLSVSRNRIDTIAGTAIYLAGKVLTGTPNYHFTNRLVVDAKVDGNFIRDVSGHGIIGQSRRTSFIGNVILSTGNAAGLQSMVIQGDMATVSGNICEGGSGVGIDMGACTNSSVTGNTVRAKGEIGIELQSCNNTTCTGNNVQSCGASVAGTNSAGISIGQGFFGGSFVTFGVVVSGNTVSAGPTPGKYGISVDGASKETIVTGNFIANSGSIAPIYVDATSKALVYGNAQGLAEETFLSLYGTPELLSRSASGNTDLLLRSQGTGRVAASISDFAVNTAGKGLRVKEGSNAKQGVATLVSGSVVVANTSITATSRIMLTSQSDGGTPGFTRVSARVVGTSFTITSSSGTDTSVIGYQIFEPA